MSLFLNSALSQTVSPGFDPPKRKKNSGSDHDFLYTYELAKNPVSGTGSFLVIYHEDDIYVCL